MSLWRHVSLDPTVWVLNVSNGGPWNPKLTLKVSGLWIKIKAQNFASQVLSKHTFKIWRKKGSGFFYHRGTLTVTYIKSFSEHFFSLMYEAFVCVTLVNLLVLFCLLCCKSQYCCRSVSGPLIITMLKAWLHGEFQLGFWKKSSWNESGAYM